MTAQRPNQLILISDEHSRAIMGCYGNRVVETPNLDRLAARGTRFANAYTPSPICVPARAALASGKYCHASSHWDNASPYCGEPESWGHALRATGRPVGSIGKLHFRDAEADVGFDFQTLPMHVVNGIGDVLGSVRKPLPKRWKSHAMAENIGPGETSYSAYDRSIADHAVEWIEARKQSDEPWTLFVSLVTPHFPLIAPQEYYDLYAEKGLMPAKTRPEREHEWHTAMRECILYDNFTPERTRVALASYYGLVTFMDAQMGRILDALQAAGLSDSTQVIYSSDHGDNAGERGLWGKSNMFEESAGVPLILAGPGIPEGAVKTTNVSLIDIYPTLLGSAGLQPPGDRPGRSLIELANAPDDPKRIVFSEYHAMGAETGAFMIRKGRWKLIHYVRMVPELYDLQADPGELTDLGQEPELADVRAELMHELRAICSPEAVNARAFADQHAIVERNGGAEAVVARGGFGATPPPGERPDYVTS